MYVWVNDVFIIIGRSKKKLKKLTDANTFHHIDDFSHFHPEGLVSNVTEGLETFL